MRATSAIEPERSGAVSCPRRGPTTPGSSRGRGAATSSPGITVGVVALPLALAFGITTGLGATAGLMTAIVAGLVAGVFGGSNVQVSGPTGAMTVVLVPDRRPVRRATRSFVVGLMAGVLVLAAVVRSGSAATSRTCRGRSSRASPSASP